MIRKKRHSGGTSVSQFQRHDDDDELLWDKKRRRKKKKVAPSARTTTILSRRSSFIHYIFAHPSTHNQRRSPIHHLAPQWCLPLSFVSRSPRQYSSSPCHAVLNQQRRRSGLAGYCLIGAHDGTSSSSRNGRRMSARSHSRQRRRQLFGKRRTTMMMISPFHRRHLVQEAPEPPLRPRASV